MAVMYVCVQYVYHTHTKGEIHIEEGTDAWGPQRSSVLLGRCGFVESVLGTGAENARNRLKFKPIVVADPKGTRFPVKCVDFHH